PQGGEGSGISLFLICASRPIFADFLFNRRELRGWLGCDFEYCLANEGLIPQLQLPERSPEHFICRHGIVSNPTIARVSIKIGTGIDRRIDVLRIEVIKLRGRFVGALRGRGLGKSEVSKFRE